MRADVKISTISAAAADAAEAVFGGVGGGPAAAAGRSTDDPFIHRLWSPPPPSSPASSSIATGRPPSAPPPSSSIRKGAPPSRAETLDDLVLVRRWGDDDDLDAASRMLVDPALLAEGMRQKLLVDVRDRRKVEEALRLRQEGEGERARLITAADGTGDTSVVAIANPAAVLVNPPAPREVASGSHSCRKECVYRPATELCGLPGCDSVAIRVEQSLSQAAKRARLADAARIAPGDVWMCRESGAVHVCTQELCDSREPDSQGCKMVCSKTRRVYESIALPTAESFVGGMFHPSGDVERQCVRDYVSSAIACSPAVACAPPSALESCPWAAAALVNASASVARRGARRPRRKRRHGDDDPGEKSVGVTAGIVGAALADLARDLLGPTASPDMAMVTESERRAEELARVFSPRSRPAGAPTASTAMRAHYYKRSVKMAAVVVVLMPVIAKAGAPPLSPGRQRTYAKHYGSLIWRGWTLVTSVPGASEMFDAQLKFLRFALGMLYNARDGVRVRFDVTTPGEYVGNESRVIAAVRAILAASPRRRRWSGDGRSDQECLDRFSRRYAITFLVPDTYLASRLLPENKMGNRNATVDRIQVESVGVNVGIRFVKEALNAVAEWSKREFLRDVLSGTVAPLVAAQSAAVRAADFLVSSRRS